MPYTKDIDLESLVGKTVVSRSELHRIRMGSFIPGETYKVLEIARFPNGGNSALIQGGDWIRAVGESDSIYRDGLWVPAVELLPDLFPAPQDAAGLFCVRGR